MQQHQTFGTYVPSYLLINLDTDGPIIQVKDLNEQNRRTFLHEYTHFLQNISGGFGVSHIWNTYDRSRQLIAILQQDHSPEIQLPLVNEVVDLEKTYFLIRRALEGDYGIRGVDAHSVQVVDLHLEPNADFEKLHPNSGVQFVRLTLRDRYAKEISYQFGEFAIAETMAYLMELKFFPFVQMNDFPYRACQKFGEFFGSPLTKDDESLFALCDVALLSRYPGWMFCEMLMELSKTGWIPKDAKEIYDFGVGVAYSHGLEIWAQYKEAVDSTCIVLNNLFDHPFFQPTSEWFQYLLRAGFDVRMSGPSFMLDLYREENVFDGLWNLLYIKFGTPQLHNKNQQRFFKPPYDFTAKETEIEPIFLLAQRQIQNLVLSGKRGRACNLKSICSQNTNGLIVDRRCDEAPWTRATDEQTCAYGALWAGYGFSEKMVTLLS